jgi:hypothetical protein
MNATTRLHMLGFAASTRPQEKPAGLPSLTAVARPVGTAVQWTPLACGLAIVAVGLSLSRRYPEVWGAMLAAGGLLAAWNAAVVLWSGTRGRTLTLSVDVRPQHYLQACAQGTVLAYWGLYWPPVSQHLPLIGAQLLFAYGFDWLLSWTRRGSCAVGFGPFPVVFSINLFLWFRPEWFIFQFVLVAVGFAAKDLIRWTRDGRRVHIFNPSSFPLAVASIVLIATGFDGITRGQDIAVSQFYPPQMYLLLFLVGLPGQFLFGVASMTWSAVLTTYLFGLAYFAVTGTYFFLDSYVPMAVFLGMHLLFTDPSTSPRTELGRLIFGALYGLSSVALYQLLTGAGVPAFYDKLLQVPLLNLSVRAIDRVARGPLRALDPARLGHALAPRQRHVAYMTLWATTFVVMSLVGGVGDRHRGQWLPFWRHACEAGRGRACEYAAQLETILCQAGSGWACNEAGLRSAQARTATDLTTRARAAREAGATFAEGCRHGFVPACRNGVRAGDPGSTLEDAPPADGDYRVLVRGSKGPVTERNPTALRARACAQGWSEAC